MTSSSSSSSPSSWIVSSLDGNGNSETTTTTDQNQNTRLFLHLDVNETILLGDDAGGDSRNESAQKMLAKSAFCRIPSGMEDESTKAMKPTHWWDGQAIGAETTMPPLYTGWEWPPNCVPYYRTAYKKHAKQFTDHHGAVYAPLLDACEAQLKSATKTSNSQGGSTILPAFYETLRHLIETQPKNSDAATVVFRTFGSDLPDIAKVITSFAKGEHPGYPNIDFPPFCLSPDRLYQGRWKVMENSSSEPTAIYQLWNSDETELVAEGDAEILEFLSTGTHRIFGIRDDYDFWKKHKYRPTAGKPIWVPSYKNNNNNKDYAHHVLFDDNIHNLTDDCIATVRREDEGSSFETVDGASMGAYQGVHLVRVPTVEPVLNPKWYVEQIDKARNRLKVRLHPPTPTTRATSK